MTYAPSRDALIQTAFEDALSEQQSAFARNREAQNRNSALLASQPQPNPVGQLEDAAAAAVAAQRGVPIADVRVNGERYGDVLAARDVRASAAPRVSTMAEFPRYGDEHDETQWVQTGDIDEVMAEVRSDPTIATFAYDAEASADQPRQPLLDALAAFIANGGAS